MISAPYPRTALILVFGASVGMTTALETPASREAARRISSRPIIPKELIASGSAEEEAAGSALARAGDFAEDRDPCAGCAGRTGSPPSRADRRQSRLPPVRRREQARRHTPRGRRSVQRGVSAGRRSRPPRARDAPLPGCVWRPAGTAPLR